jgi:hypothetical protein
MEVSQSKCGAVKAKTGAATGRLERKDKSEKYIILVQLADNEISISFARKCMYCHGLPTLIDAGGGTSSKTQALVRRFAQQMLCGTTS